MANLIMLYGDTDSGKTSNAGFFARYVYKKTGKPLRAIYADNGGYKTIQPYVDAGIINPFHIGSAPNPLPTVVKLTRDGLWPETLKNGTIQADSQGRLMMSPTKDWSAIGGYIVEGLTSICELFLEDNRSKQRNIGQDAVGKFEEEGIKFAANSQTHYGFSQREGMALLKRLGALPVPYVLITAHEAKGEDKETRTPIRGPALVGSAATDNVGKEVAELIHAEVISENEDAITNGVKSIVRRKKLRYYFESHPDPKFETTNYKCKARVPPEMVDALRERWPAGYFEPSLTEGLDTFLEFEDSLLEKGSGATMKWKQEMDAARAGGVAK